MAKVERTIIIVLDGVGIGELPDAHKYNDQGSHTLGNLSRAVGGFNLPNLQAFGLGNIDALQGMPPATPPKASFGKMAEVSPGKDSTTGHWEIAGCQLDFDFPTYPNGFPEEILKPFREATGRGVLGNKPASGTEIIKELGEEHLRTGDLIVYTSADSVFQIAAHEEVVPLEELYRICEIARKLLTGKHAVSRVIARPFIGTSADNFQRTRGRRDFSLKPPTKLMQHYVKDAGLPTVAIGKIDDLYAGEGWETKLHTKSNADGIAEILRQLETVPNGLIMLNLVDFDMLWGHRNNPEGFYGELKAFDEKLPELLARLKQGDMLILTADHGNDPTTPSTDHAREYVPLLVYGPNLKNGVALGVRQSFADLGKTVLDAMNISENKLKGESFWPLIQPSGRS